MRVIQFDVGIGGVGGEGSFTQDVGYTLEGRGQEIFIFFLLFFYRVIKFFWFFSFFISEMSYCYLFGDFVDGRERDIKLCVCEYFVKRRGICSIGR